MAKPGTRKQVESVKALSRLPHLVGARLRFNLSDELRHLREADSYQRESGRSSRTLAKYPDFRVVLVLMKANSEMKEHHADARISIHTLQGKIRIRLPGEKIELSAGELLALDYGIRHDVEALEECAFLITIAWPGDTADERHGAR